MSEIKLTVSQLAHEIGETDHTVRNWLKSFRHYIPSEKSSGGYNLFNQDAINVIWQIKKMYREQNLSTKQIEAILAGADRPAVRTEEAAAAIESFESVRDLLEEQRIFNAELLKRLDQQHEQFEKFVNRRDEQIMYVLRELQHAREQKQLSGKTIPWYKRLLKG